MKQSYPCRCRKCDKRKSLDIHPDSYPVDENGNTNAPACKCGSTQWRIDKFRFNKQGGNLGDSVIASPEYTEAQKTINEFYRAKFDLEESVTGIPDCIKGCRIIIAVDPASNGDSGTIVTARAEPDGTLTILDVQTTIAEPQLHIFDAGQVNPVDGNKRQRTFPPKPTINRESTLRDCRTNYRIKS